MKSVYGPVPSWRFGRSLGIDPICKRKACNFDCVYCQLGMTTELTNRRRIWVETNRIKEDLNEVKNKVKADVITFSGTGEPTLALNLAEAIGAVREILPKQIVVLTNSGLLYDPAVRKDLMKADVVVAKLDAHDQESFFEINKPHKDISFRKVISGIRTFRKDFEGKLMLQMMFIDLNKDSSGDMAEIAKKIKPDVVQINTPLRPTSVKPLSRAEIKKIRKDFSGLDTVSVYEAKKPEIDFVLADTHLRRP